MNGNIQLEGTELKYNLQLTLPSGLSMDDVDFTARFFIVSSRMQVITKADMTRVDKDNYTMIVDTSVIGYGVNIKCEVDVEIQDETAENGKRMEKILIELGENIRHAV